MSTVVIVAYRPKPGRDAALLALTRAHVPLLQRLGLATDRPGVVLRSRDGVIVELFEWRQGAMERAHADAQVLALWEQYAAVCDYVPLRDLPEAADLFAQFTPIHPG